MSESIPRIPQEIDLSLDSYSTEVNLRNRLTQYVDNYRVWSEKHPYQATTVESVGLVALKGVIGKVGKSFGIDLSNGHSQSHNELANEHPVMAAAYVTALAPVSEELLWRNALPNTVKKKLKIEEESKASKVVDHLSALSFAAGHTGNPLTEKGRSNLAIPLTPLIGGEYYNFLARKRGFKHAVLAHAINNTFALAVQKIF